MEGGGIKGYCYPWAMKELQDRGVIDIADAKGWAGTSAGAITAGLFAVGYTPDELIEILGVTDFGSFKAGGWMMPFRLIFRQGAYSVSVFRKWYKDLLKAKTGNSLVTFKDVPTLKVYGTNLTLGKVQEFSVYETPNMPIEFAVTISMDIPGFFQGIKWNGYQMCDGGVVKNFPIDAFDDFGRVIGRNSETLGFRVDSPSEIRHEPKKMSNVISRLMAVVAFSMDFANRSYLEPEDKDRTIIIESGGIPTTKFSLAVTEMQTLRDNAEFAVGKFLVKNTVKGVGKKDG